MAGIKAKEIAEFLETEIIGSPAKIISKVGYLYTAKTNELAYCFLKDVEKDLDAIRKTNASIVICHTNLKSRLIQLKVKPVLILSETPKYDFARVLHRFFLKEKRGVSPLASIGKNVSSGKDLDVHPGAIIYDDTKLGTRVTIRANAVLGAEGLDYGRNKIGELVRVPHMSNLIIEDDVDIGSNTTIQRGILRPTIIGRGSKIGPNCNIGHEVNVGKNCVITGMTMIAGATEVGAHTFIAPHSTIKNSIKIGRNVFVGIGSLVITDIPDETVVVGRPAIEINKFRKYRKRLKELLRES